MKIQILLMVLYKLTCNCSAINIVTKLLSFLSIKKVSENEL